MKEWILLQCVNNAPEQSLIGWEFATWQQGISLLAGALPIPTRTELMSALWLCARQSPPPQWQPFLVSEKKTAALVEKFASLFYDYSLYGLPKAVHWQIEFFNQIFEQYSWKPFYQILSEADIERKGAVYLFGIDWVPPAAMQFFLRHPKCRIFRFSPTAMFWEDVRSAREQKSLIKQAKKKNGASAQIDFFDSLLRESHPLLSNWGVLGRKMACLLKDLEPVENYQLLEDPHTLLHRLQTDVLTMQAETKCWDRSIRVIRTGVSKLREVEALRDEILHCAERGILFSDIRVYAPDITIYASLIAFIFKDIPFRVAGVDLARQSCYFQAFERLCALVYGRWEVSEWESLLFNRAFTDKQRWQVDDIDQIRAWISQGKIRWGLDTAHQSEIMQSTVGESAGGVGTWDSGFDKLIDSLVFFTPEQDLLLSRGDADLFQAFYQIFTDLKTLLMSWKAERSLEQWAQQIEHLLSRFLLADNSDEDSAAKNLFAKALETLRKTHEKVNGLFSFAFVQKCLFQASKSEVNSSQLHGVRFASLENGAMLPARALFFLGMDEESFPRTSGVSSLHLLKKEGVFFPQNADIDRYLFLQALLSAQTQITFLYGHISSKDGKFISPSLLLQELLDYLNDGTSDVSDEKNDGRLQMSVEALIETVLPTGIAHLESSSLYVSPLKQPRAPSPDHVVSVNALNKWIKNPFEYFLKNIAGLSFKERVCSIWEEFEFSYLTQYLVLSQNLAKPIEQVLERFTFPPGIIGTKLRRELLDSAQNMQTHLQEWQIAHIQQIALQESCTGSRQVLKERLEVEPIVVQCGDVQVRLIGEVYPVSLQGPLVLGDGSFKAIVHRWPELLVAMIATGTNSIYLLREGTKLCVKDPLGALTPLLELYLQYGNSTPFWHKDWILMMLSDAASDFETCDEILQWVLKRSPHLDLELERRDWAPLLRIAFEPLIAIYEGENDADI